MADRQERAAPMLRPLGDGVAVRARELPARPGRWVVADAAGRFVLVPDEALAGSAAARARLVQLGFAARAPLAARPPVPGVPRHVVRLDAATDEATARAIARRIAESPAATLQVEIRGERPLAGAAAVFALVDALHAAAPSRALVTLCSALGGAAPEALGSLVDRGVLFEVPFDPSSSGRAGLEALATSHAARGLDPEAAYVRAVVELPASPAEARGAVDACAAAGLAYVELRAGADRDEAWRSAIDRVLDLNAAGTLLVERSLAMRLEAIVAAPSAPALPAWDALGYAADGEVHALVGAWEASSAIGHVARDAADELERRAIAWGAARAEAGAGCEACAYASFCDAPLVRASAPAELRVVRAWDGPWCRASMHALDRAFGAMASERAADLRATFARWTRARDRVAARLSARG